MNRLEFLKMAGTGVAVCACGSFISCGNKSQDPVPNNVDFTLDLTQTANVALTRAGGSLTNQGILIVCISVGVFTAVYPKCTHEGVTVNFVTNKFVCPEHGATFDTSGAVTKGPATSALKTYNTKLTGNMLRVYA